MKTALIILVLVLIWGFGGSAATQTITSVQNGYWHDASTWSVVSGSPEFNDDVLVQHDVIVEGHEECHNLTVAESGSVITVYGYRTLSVFGDLDIRGDVFSSVGGWPLDVTLHGDLTLSGTLTPSSITFAGSIDQHLTLTNGAVIAPRNTWITGSADLIADTDLRLATMLDMSGSNLELSADHDITFLDGHAINGVITANGNAIISSGGAYLGVMTVADAELCGLTRAYSSMTFTGTTTVTDTLESHFGHVFVTFDDVVNNGVIRNGDWTFDSTVLGDVIDNGTWTGHQLTFGGAGRTHALIQAEGVAMATDYFELAEDTGPLTLHGAITFNTIADLNQGEVILAPGAQLTVAAGDFGRGRLVADGGVINSFDGADLVLLEVSNGVFMGVTSIYSSATFTGQTVNEGVLRNAAPGSGTLVIDGDIVNRGTIVDGDGTSFYLEIKGDLENLGTWTNLQTKIIGNEDQTLAMDDDHLIGGTMLLYSLLAGDSHQWLLNDSAWPSGTESTCALAPLMLAHRGVWHCTSSAGTSRLITIGDPTATGVGNGPPAALTVIGNHPNPFNPATEIRFTLGDRGRVRIDIFDLGGRLIRTLADQVMEAGEHRVAWNAERQASGVYFYRITGGGRVGLGRCLLLK